MNDSEISANGAARPLIIGLTGNIATGKSTIMKLAAQRGALTIDADRVVHQVLSGDATVQDAIRAAFGDDVFDADGAIIRPALGRIVFADSEALARLEQIVHPAVRRTIADAIERAVETVVMVEAIKLLEGPLHKLCDQIWVTTCSPYVQIERLKRYRQMSEEDARVRVEAQNPQEEKIARADVVIDTNESLSATEAQFEGAWRRMVERRGIRDENR